MSAPNTFYLTAAIPYVNAKPHLGHVLEWFQADAIARYHQLLGETVFFSSGADENSLKNVQAAEKAGIDVQDWLDQYSKIFENYFKQLNISLTAFRRGSDQVKHWPGVQELWNRCVDSGDIYKKTYSGLYCVGCESFYTPEDLIDGKCPEHFTTPEKITEENYFFRLSKYQDEIKRLIESDELHIFSDTYKHEMLGFIGRELEDFSVSRSAKRARGVGVPVPEDPEQVMYVWFDALSIYLTAAGWGYDPVLFKKFWPAAVHVIGKGINRFHSVYWIGMLLSAKLALPKQICVHGYITANGQKMSKSLGNVIDPFDVVKQYSLESVRYFLLKEIPTHSDGDFSHQRFGEVYTADLANGLGNLCSRVAKLCEKYDISGTNISPQFDAEFSAFFDALQIDQAAKWVAKQVTLADQFLNEQKPWKQEADERQKTLVEAVSRIASIAFHLQPFMPETAQTILHHFQQPKITALAPLFPRLETGS